MIKISSLHILKQSKHFYRFFYSTTFFLFLVSINYSQESNDDSIKEYYSKEKVYIHFDKPYYASGDDIWFKVYLVNADTHQQNAISKIVYVDLIDSRNEVIASKVIKIINGNGLGDFNLDLNLDTGVYTIRAYTNFMRNFDSGYFFRKKINVSSVNLVTNSKKIIPPMNKVKESATNTLHSIRPDIHFFPEGGYLVNSLVNRMGFKALDSNGKGIDIEGSIVDGNGHIITMFKSSKFGLGKIVFIPEKHIRYKVSINYNRKIHYYDLPRILDEGIVMRIEERQNHYQIKLQSSINKSLKKLILQAQQHEKIICNVDINVAQNKATIKVMKTLLKQGVIQFTLLDKNIVPLCERLVFLENNEQQAKIGLFFSKKIYSKRELIELELTLEAAQKENYADVSISVTDASVVDSETYGLDIRSYLLLNSELKGEIENPGYYFMSSDPERKNILDILMMTQGWRRFVYRDTSKGSILNYNFEKGISFNGKLTNKGKKVSNKEITLFFKNEEIFFLQKMETNNQGNFRFGDFDIVDSTSIIIQVTNLKEINRNHQGRVKRIPYNGSIKLEKFHPPSVTFSQDSEVVNNNDNYLKRILKIQQEDLLYKSNEEFIQLEEIELKAVKVISDEEIRKEKKRKNNALYSKPTYVVDFYGLEPTGSVLEMLASRVPGGLIRGENSLIAVAQPLFLYNGMPIDITAVENLDIYSIDFIDIKKGPTAIYGSKGANGVVAIYTKDGTKRRDKPKIEDRKGIISFIHPGYSRAREFYEPVYKEEKPKHIKPDSRSTICWRPMVKLEGNKKIKISFYAADIPTSYRVELQGITSKGIPIISEEFIYID